jgi:hypothetical protein
MSGRITLATTVRVLSQIRHDQRTIGLLLVVPSALLFLLQQLLGDRAFDRLGAPMVGMFPFITMFLVTSISMLRERTTGTLERLMTMPLAKLDLLGGYGIAFALLATAQALVTSGFVFLVLGLDTPGSPALIVFLAVVDGVLGSALGLLASAFASCASNAKVSGRTEAMASSQSAIWSRGTSRPQSRICGSTKAGMNWTAWNSLEANALASSPSAEPSTALRTASAMMRAAEPAASSPSARNATAAVISAWSAASSAKAIP